MVQERLDEEQNYLEQAALNLKQGVRQLVTEEEHRFEINLLHLRNNVPKYLKVKNDRFQKNSQRLAVAGQRLLKDEVYDLQHRIGELQYGTLRMLRTRQVKLDESKHVLKIRMKDGFRLQTNKLEAFGVRKRLVDPVRVLKRGYSLAYKDGKIIKSVTELTEGDELQTCLSDGSVVSKIIKKQ